MPPGTRTEPQINPEISLNSYHKWSNNEKVVYLMTQLNITRKHLDTIPVAIDFLIHQVLWACRENPPTDWSVDAYYLIQRPDLAAQAFYDKNYDSETNQRFFSNQATPNTIKQPESETDDGMDDVESSLLQLRFPDDRRVAEVRRLLQSSEPVEIRVVQRPEVNDHDFIEEQEKHLYAICTRTMALSVGR